ATRTLVLARDRLGIKPLYYALLPDQLVFGSELRALLEHPDVSRELDLTSLSLYLAHEYVPAPRAILRGIRKLPAGHWLTYSDGQVKVEPYWDVPLDAVLAIDEHEAVDRLRATLDETVRQHLVSALRATLGHRCPVGRRGGRGLRRLSDIPGASPRGGLRTRAGISSRPHDPSCGRSAAGLARQSQRRLPPEALRRRGRRGCRR